MLLRSIMLISLLLWGGSCKKWVDYRDVPETERTRQTGELEPGTTDPVPGGTPAGPTDPGTGDSSPGTDVPPADDQETPVPDGHVRIEVKTIKSETEAYFQNCLTLAVSGSAAFNQSVGCNKKQTGVTFLDTAFKRDFEVTNGEQVDVSLVFSTWRNQSDCITYGDCANPYPGDPVQRSLKDNSTSLRCFKVSEQAYRLYYEDQPDTNREADFVMRKNLLQSDNVSSPEPFNPEKPTLDAVYSLKPGFSLDSSQASHRCLQLKNEGSNGISERSLQACFGIDFRDFVIDVSAQNAGVIIGEFTDEICEAI